MQPSANPSYQRYEYLQEEVAQYEDVLASVQAKQSSAELQRNTLTEQIKQTQIELTSLEAKTHKLKNLQHQLEREIDQYEGQINEVEEENQQLTQEVREKTRELNFLKLQHITHLREIEQNDYDVEKLQEQIRTLTIEYDKLHKAYQMQQTPEGQQEIAKIRQDFETETKRRQLSIQQVTTVGQELANVQTQHESQHTTRFSHWDLYSMGFFLQHDDLYRRFAREIQTDRASFTNAGLSTFAVGDVMNYADGLDYTNKDIDPNELMYTHFTNRTNVDSSSGFQPFESLGGGFNPLSILASPGTPGTNFLHRTPGPGGGDMMGNNKSSNMALELYHLIHALSPINTIASILRPWALLDPNYLNGTQIEAWQNLVEDRITKNSEDNNNTNDTVLSATTTTTVCTGAGLTPFSAQSGFQHAQTNNQQSTQPKHINALSSFANRFNPRTTNTAAHKKSAGSKLTQQKQENRPYYYTNERFYQQTASLESLQDLLMIYAKNVAYQNANNKATSASQQQQKPQPAIVPTQDDIRYAMKYTLAYLYAIYSDSENMTIFKQACQDFLNQIPTMQKFGILPRVIHADDTVSISDDGDNDDVTMDEPISNTQEQLHKCYQMFFQHAEEHILAFVQWVNSNVTPANDSIRATTLA